MPTGEPVIPAVRAEFLESGVQLAVATVRADGLPDCGFAVGVRVAPDLRRVTLFLPDRASAPNIANLRENGKVAVTATRACDYQTLQLKGRALRVTPAPEEDRPFVLAYREAFVAQLEKVGQPRSRTGRLVVWPCVAVEVEVDAAFEQTPGPRAGAILRAR